MLQRAHSSGGVRGAAGLVVVLVMLLMPTAAPAGTQLDVTGLETNSATRPLGIDDRTPRLRWRLESDQRGVEQKQYRVLVATSASKTRAGRADVWDSRTVRSSQPFVDYDGPVLSSRTRYYWTVRVWPDEGAPTDWSGPTWFETAYLRESEWEGGWIAGPARTEGVLTDQQAFADDACCLQGDTVLTTAVAAGAGNLKVASVSGFAPGQRIEVDSGADREVVTLTSVGTGPGSTTAAVAAPAGATRVHVGDVDGFAVGGEITVGSGDAAETRQITEVGTTIGQNRTLFAPASAGDTNVKVSNEGGFVVGEQLVVGAGDAAEVRTVTAVGTRGRQTSLTTPAAAGDTTINVGSLNGWTVGTTVTIDTGAGLETRTVESLGAGDGTGVGLNLPLSAAHASGATVRMFGTGITFDSPLQAAHAMGEPTRGLGTGIAFSPALSAGHAAGESITTPGTGLDVTPPLSRAHLAGARVLGPPPKDFCRPPYDSPFSGECKEIRPAPLLRRAFSVQPVSAHGRVVSARVYASGLAWNQMTLNGRETVEDGFLNPGFTSYDKTVEYTTDDVTGLIRQDSRRPTQNVIATALGSGRYDNEAVSGDHGWERAEFRANPTLRADLYVTYADGTEQLVKTDESWRTSDDGPVRYDNYDLGETYDARMEIPGWDEPGFEASDWDAARRVDGPAGRLIAQKQDRTRKVAEWPAGTRSEPVPGTLLWDTGQQRVGWATVSVHGAPAGTPIQVRFGEKLGADGLISLSGYAPDGQIQTHYYVSDGSGTAGRPERFEPRFTFNGFQYIQISGAGNTPLPAGVTVDVESVQEVRTDMATAGAFRSSNDLINRIERTTRASIVANYVAGIIMDTPTYEKDGWTGDAQLSLPTAALMFDTRRQNQHTTQNIIDDQYADGQVSLLTPGNENYGYSGPPSVPVFKPANGGATPIWDALLHVAPWESYFRFGDDRTLAHAYPSMKRYLSAWIPRWFAADGDGYDHTLTSGLGDWSRPTGASAPDGSATDVNMPTINAPSSTAYVAYLAQITADAARVLDKRGEAAQFDDLYESIKDDFNAKWWDASVGYYRENANQFFVQTFQVLALAFDLVPESDRRGLQEKLVHDIMVTREGHQMTGIAGARWIYPVLSEAAYEGVPGADEAAYTIARQTTYPSYGFWASLGWTGLGETWETGSRTRNHHMFGSISQWFYEGLAGIRPAKPGYREIAFKPTIADGIDHADASYESVRGTISAEWRQTSDGLVYEISVPANATGTVYLPGTRPNRVREAGTGRSRPASHAPGVSFAGVSNGHTVYRIGSGDYEFRVE